MQTMDILVGDCLWDFILFKAFCEHTEDTNNINNVTEVTGRDQKV